MHHVIPVRYGDQRARPAAGIGVYEAIMRVHDLVVKGADGVSQVPVIKAALLYLVARKLIADIPAPDAIQVPVVAVYKKYKVVDAFVLALVDFARYALDVALFYTLSAAIAFFWHV